MSSRLPHAIDRYGPPVLRLVGALGTVLLVLFAVRLLGTATAAAAPSLERVLREVVVGDVSALGLGWLGAYVLANGSVVAALGLSLSNAGLLSPSELFLTVAGSRLGGAAVVVFIGALDWFGKRRQALRESVSMGLLAFLLTHSIYLPATVLGYAALPALLGRFIGVGGGWTVGFDSTWVVEAVALAVTARIGPTASILLAVAVLFGSLKLFDRLLEAVDTETLRRRFFGRLENTWLSFVAGVFVTGVTTSVAFSLGVIVPLYNRGYIRREELIPYVLGANIGTLFDTIVVAVVLESPVGLVVVLELLAAATLVTLVVLLAEGTYSQLVSAADERLLEDRRAFVAFVLSLLLVPLALVAVPLASVLAFLSRAG
ncbi:MAG: sodium:phosphate symporter [Haloarculaceae archaeon]